MATLTLCEQYFETRDIYKLLDVEKDASQADIKKAYYKMSLKVHPDRVGEMQKQLATEKFKVLSKIYQVLSDKDKRALYDEQGVIEEEDDLDSKVTTWLELWRKIFKPLTTEDIENYQKTYVDSELERADIKKAYLSGKGCINHMMNEVPFLKVEDEPRLQKIVKELIAANEVPEFTIFTKEPSQKRNRRHKKYARESEEAKKLFEKLNSSKNLEQQLMERQKARANDFTSLLDKLAEKYGGNDDSDVVDFGAKKRKGKSKRQKQGGKTENLDTGLHEVKSGRIVKRRNK